MADPLVYNVTPDNWTNVTNGAAAAFVEGPSGSYQYYYGTASPGPSSPAFTADESGRLTITNLPVGENLYLRSARAPNKTPVRVTVKA